VADLCLFDPDAEWTVTPEALLQPGQAHALCLRATGMALPGRVRATLVAGTVASRLTTGADARLALALWRLLRAVLHGLHGVAIVLLRFPSLDRGGQREARRWWSAKMLRCWACGCAVRGSFRPGAKLLVANHVSWLDIMAVHAVCPEARFVSKAEVRHWPLVNRLVGGRRHALHRAREASATRCAWCTRWPRRCGRRHGGGLPRRHHRAGPRPAALPRQPAAGGDRHRHAGAAGGAALRRPRHAVSPAALWVGDTTLAQSLWRLATADGLVVPPAGAAGAGHGACRPAALAERCEWTSSRRWPRDRRTTAAA
jgi:1-acyl-sn-glycerol-3-phosphate acyltransferase